MKDGSGGPVCWLVRFWTDAKAIPTAIRATMVRTAVAATSSPRSCHCPVGMRSTPKMPTWARR